MWCVAFLSSNAEVFGAVLAVLARVRACVRIRVSHTSGATPFFAPVASHATTKGEWGRAAVTSSPEYTRLSDVVGGDGRGSRS